MDRSGGYSSELHEAYIIEDPGSIEISLGPPLAPVPTVAIEFLTRPIQKRTDMGEKKAIKRVKLAAIIAMALASAIAATSRNEAQIERPKLEILGYGVPLAERLGADDGAQVVIHFSGDTHGSLEPCG
jgi:hypothetical protein